MKITKSLIVTNATICYNYILARLDEVTTWEGIIGFGTLLASWLRPQYLNIIGSAGVSIWSLLKIITKDATSKVGKAVEAAVEAHDNLNGVIK